MGLIPAAAQADPQTAATDYLETVMLSGETVAGTAEHATVDPNLLVLCFLFGFCLLYVVFLALDTLEGRRDLKR